MSNASPELKANELFNALAMITLEDVDAAKGIATQARVLNRQLPGDFTTKVAFGEALLLSGERSKAVEQLHAAFSIRDKSNYSVMDRLALLLSFIGDRDRALKATEEVAFVPTIFDTGPASGGGNHAQIATWAGDLDLLNRLVERDSRAGATGTAEWFLRVLKDIDADADFVLHQRALIEAVRDVQVAMCTLWVCDENCTTLINNVIFDRYSVTRSEIEERVEKALRYALQHRLEDRVSNVFTASPEVGAGRFRVISSEPVAR